MNINRYPTFGVLLVDDEAAFLRSSVSFWNDGAASTIFSNARTAEM